MTDDINAIESEADMRNIFNTTQENVLLRAQSSPRRIHVMREFCPSPFRVILPGTGYRYEKSAERSEMRFKDESRATRLPIAAFGTRY